MVTTKPTKKKPELTKISELRRCTYEEAVDLCNQIRSLCSGNLPSNKCIAEAMEQLGDQQQPYVLEDIARLAMQIHAPQVREKLNVWRRPKILERAERPPKLPRFVVHPDGTVTTSKVLDDEKYLE